MSPVETTTAHLGAPLLTLSLLTALCSGLCADGAEYRVTATQAEFEQWTPILLVVEPTEEGSIQNAEELELTVQAPSGKRLNVPVFRSIDGKGAIECRFTPRETGSYSARVNDASEPSASADVLAFEVNPSPNRQGFVRTSGDLPYHMLHDNGDQFRGIGVNIAWEPRRRANPEHTYDALFPRISAHGLNTVRTWMCPWNLPMEWDTEGLGEYDPDSLQRLDEMLELARQNGLYVVLVLGYHGEMQKVSGAFPNNDRWKENPYNAANGGPCDSPADFFTNPEAKRLYKKRLRTLVARVGGHPNLLAWELWNEFDHFQRRGPVPGDVLVVWHEEMAEYLKSLDHYDRAITTSISTEAPPGMWEVAGLDLIMLHPYGKTDKLIEKLRTTYEKHDKPVIAGEFSYSWKPPKRHEREQFERELRLGLWRGLMAPTPVLPMTWWWEFHDRHDDWRLYSPVAEISQRMLTHGDPTWRPLSLDISASAVECRALEVGNEVFVWVCNTSDTRASDIDVVLSGVTQDSLTLAQYDTLTGDRVQDPTAKLKMSGGKSTIRVPLLEGDEDRFYVLSSATLAGGE